jgi:dihydroorotate dehydrogenase electron transfer subunit
MCLVPCASCSAACRAPGTEHRAPATRHNARNTRHKAPGTRHQAQGTARSTKHLALGTCYTFPVPFDIDARVIENRRLSSDYNVLSLEAPDIAGATEPGQFVMVKPDRSIDPLLRRPFSVFEILCDGDRPVGVSILSKRVGITTAQIFDAQAGQRVQCLGPLGRGFTLPDPATEVWMVAGGVGLAPFWTVAERLARRGVRLTLFYGGRRDADLFYLDYFEQRDVTLVLCTEDGSRGERGRVTIPLERALAARPAGTDVLLHACGPEPMLAAVARLAARYGCRCEVSVERVMGCGLGGCYSCVVPVKAANGFHHVRSCIGGPIFDAATLVWD